MMSTDQHLQRHADALREVRCMALWAALTDAKLIPQVKYDGPRFGVRLAAKGVTYWDRQALNALSDAVRAHLPEHNPSP